MNKHQWFWLSALLAGVAFFEQNVESTREDPKTRLRLMLEKPSTIGQVHVTANNWNYIMSNQGSYMMDRTSGWSAGGEFPRGSGIAIVFAGGFLVGTLKNDTAAVSEAGFMTDFQAGRITNSDVPFDELTAEDPNGPLQKVYLIDRSMSGDDYSNWPGERDVSGRPGLIAEAQTWTVFNDTDTSLCNSQGVFDAYDGFNNGLGIQVTLESFAFTSGLLSNVVFLKFTILNKTNVDYPESYLGLWMDADVGASVQYPYGAMNDVAGVDTSKGLGFMYNNDNTDAPTCAGFDFFQGPVVNMDEIPTALAERFDSNRSTLEWDASGGNYVSTHLAEGKIWLGATSFTPYVNGLDPDGDLERYRVLKGLDRLGNGRFGVGALDYYGFRGNPFGDRDDPNVDNVGNDKRMLHGVGPFIMRAGESQVIWAGVVGGLGSNNLDAVRDMFNTDSLAQMAFESGFAVPAAPDMPRIRVVPLDGRVAITWENNSELSTDLYGWKLGINQENGYTARYDSTDFQGYRVYRSRTGLPGTYQRLAQYDLADGKTIIQNAFINSNGHLGTEDVVVGTDNGLKYHFTDSTVVNGQRYFYSVTAYDAQPYIANTRVFFVDSIFDTIPAPSGLPISLESPQSGNVVSVVPSGPTATSKFDAAVSGNLTHVSGGSTGTVDIEVVDPGKVTGHEYRIEFFELPDRVDGAPVRGLTTGTIGYRITDITMDSVVRFSSRADDPVTFVDRDSNGLFEADTDHLYDERFFSTAIAVDDNIHSDEDFAIADGLLIRVFEVDNAGNYFMSVTYGAGTPYEGAGVATPWFVGPETFTSQEDLDRSVSSPDSSLGPAFGGVGNVYSAPSPDQRRNVELVFSRDSSEWQNAYAHTSHNSTINRYVRVPFRAYEIDGADGDVLPRLLNVMICDRNRNGQPSLAWALTNGNNSQFGGLTDNTGPQIRGFVGIDTSTYDLSGYSAGSGPVGPDNLLYGTTPSQRLVHAVFTPTMKIIESLPDGVLDGKDWNDTCKAIFGGDLSVDQGRQGMMYRMIPDEGTIRIRVDHPFAANDVYAFSTSANTTITSRKELRGNLKNIKVVPNPYYGRSAYQMNAFDKVIKFTNLPGRCTIRIFTVSGDLVRTLLHHDVSNNDRVNTDPLTADTDVAAQETAIERWDLRNTKGRFVASGMYVAVIEGAGGSVIRKFAVIQEANIPSK